MEYVSTNCLVPYYRKEDGMGKPQNFSKREVNGPRFSWFTPPTLRSWIDNSQAQTSYPVFLKVILWRPAYWLQAVYANFPRVPWWGKVKLRIRKIQKSRKENREESKPETGERRGFLGEPLAKFTYKQWRGVNAKGWLFLFEREQTRRA